MIFVFVINESLEHQLSARFHSANKKDNSSVPIWVIEIQYNSIGK